MTHEETSFQTKCLLSNTLKDLIKQKPFSKITVSEIISICNLNRKTFYYHFSDIYALLVWTIEQEAIDVVKNFDMKTDYRDVFSFVFDYVTENAAFLNGVYNSVGRDELKRFFYQDISGITQNIVNEIASASDTPASMDYQDFVCDFYTEAIAGLVIKMFQNPKKYDKDTLLTYIATTIRNSLPILLSQHT